MDRICRKVGLWPHAVLAGHAHSDQRFIRLRDDGTEIPYIICGNGGHNVQRLHGPNGTVLRTPQTIANKTTSDDAVTFENYDDLSYGYLRIIVDPQQLRIGQLLDITGFAGAGKPGFPRPSVIGLPSRSWTDDLPLVMRGATFLFP